MKTKRTLVFLLVLLPMGILAQSLPDRAGVLDNMKLANEYFMQKWADFHQWGDTCGRTERIATIRINDVKHFLATQL